MLFNSINSIEKPKILDVAYFTKKNEIQIFK